MADEMNIPNPTDRDLLVRLLTEMEGLTEKVSGIEEKMEKKDEADKKILVDLTIVKTKVMLWGALGGIAASAIMLLVSMVFDHIIK